MRTNKLIYGIGLVLLALALFYIGSDLSSGSFFKKRTKASGKTITDSLSTVSLQSLVSNSNCTIELIASDQERVVFTYEDQYYQNKSTYNNGELEINFDQDDYSFIQIGPNSEVKVKVYYKNLSKITQSGVGDIVSKDTLHGTDLTIMNEGVGDINLHVLLTGNLLAQNDGVGEIELKGECQSAKLINEGTGDINAHNLHSKIASVINDGVGDVMVMASDTLHLTNQGTGDIEYSGNAFLATNKSDGVGEIKKR
jgi:hypothetical protein